MKSLARSVFARLLFAIAVSCACARAKADKYLFAYFKGNETAAQQIYFALGAGGFDFAPLGQKPFIAGACGRSGGLRDPHIMRADDGSFRLVATDMDYSKGKWTARGILMATSANLVDWQTRTVHFPERYAGTVFAQADAVWAPQTIRDDKTGRIMVYFSLHSPKDGPFPKDAVYWAYANDDFTDLATEPQPLFQYPDPTIDTDIVRDRAGRYHCFFNTWGATGLRRRQYVFTDLHSPETWELLPGDAKPQGETLKSEGSSAYELPDGDWALAYDCFADGVFRFCRSTDGLATFTLESETSTAGDFTPRHGSVIRITDGEASALARAALARDFENPPPDVKIGCYYYWVNERVDEEGVKKDLAWMKQNGIDRAFLATDIRNRTRFENPWEGQRFGDVEFMGEKWWRCLRTALKTAGELDIEMGLFNCPGWSQSGGPWVAKEDAQVAPDGSYPENGPCSPAATGYEVSKTDRRAVRRHMDSFIGEILRRIPAAGRKSLSTIVVDSWERGRVVKPEGDARALSDIIAEEYMGEITRYAHEHGLSTWCEPYSHSRGGWDGNSVTYGAAADEVAAEFWAGEPKNERRKEISAALGAARAAGKNLVYAESFTSGSWKNPAKDDWSFESLKPYADKFFHKGVNATILHVVISQPGDDSQEPVRPWFGTFFDRRSKNAAEMKRLVPYLKRCNFMLRLGKAREGKTDERIFAGCIAIRFTQDSLFEVSFPDGSVEYWNPDPGGE